MIKKLPFEIISEKSDLDWMDANPGAIHIDYCNLANSSEKRDHAVSLVRNRKLVVIRNEDELLGAFMPNAMLQIHQLLAEENTDGFFKILKNAVPLSALEGEHILSRYNDEYPATLIFSKGQSVCGFVSPDFLKSNLVADQDSNCLFAQNLRSNFERGIEEWDSRLDQVCDHIAEVGSQFLTQDFDDPKSHVNAALMYLGAEKYNHYAYYVEELIRENKILAMIAPDNDGNHQVRAEPNRELP